MRYVIVGGGIAGLTVAYRLQRLTEGAGKSAEFLVLEAGERIGGHALTLRDEGFLVEAGPNGFLDRHQDPDTRSLVSEVGLDPELTEARPESARRFILKGGKLRRVPEAPPLLLTSDALSPLGKIRLLLEPFSKGPPAGVEETIYQFSNRRIGREATENLVDAAISGISAGDIRELSVAAAFPMMIEMERDHGSLIKAMMARKGQPKSRLVSFQRGIESLTDKIGEKLGPAVRTSSPVRRLERAGEKWRLVLDGDQAIEADHVTLALPAWHAAPLVADLDSHLSHLLASYPSAGLAVVGVAYRKSDITHDLNGYGFLVTRGEGLETLGIVWDSSLFEGRAPDDYVLLRVMIGGVRHPESVSRSEAELEQMALRNLADTMGITATPHRTWVMRWPQAIGQYTLGHLGRVAEARARAANYPDLELCGSAYDGVAFPAAVASGERAAERIHGKRKSTPDGAAETETTQSR
jgi:oxygen-dependent protoporphyrinogen oxidase